MTKKIGLVIKFSDKKCSEKERDYRRAQYIAKLIEWSNAQKKVV